MPQSDLHPSIPRPRGSRAKNVALILLAACLLAIQWENSLSYSFWWLILHLASLQVGQLFKRACLMAEELCHTYSRYQGSHWRALRACLGCPIRTGALLMLACFACFLVPEEASLHITWTFALLGLSEALNILFGLKV